MKPTAAAIARLEQLVAELHALGYTSARVSFREDSLHAGVTISADDIDQLLDDGAESDDAEE